MDQTAPPSGDDILHLLVAHATPQEIEQDGIWLRARMSLLDPIQRSGWKLHLSATPASFYAMLHAALPVIAREQVPIKILRDVEEVERMCAGERGLMQVGKVATIYPRTEEDAARIAEALRAVLRGMPGPVVPSDLAYCDDAPIYFRYGPYDGRVVIDAMAQERRLVWRQDLGRDVWDLTSGGTDEQPLPHTLPQRAAPDHLAFLRARYRLLKMLQLTAKGGVFIGVEAGSEPPGPLLIKTARPGTNSDLQGRDAVWALRREHALLCELQGVAGVPEAGMLIGGDTACAIVRPYLHGETFWEVWTGPGARMAGVQARLAGALDEVDKTLANLHARGIVVRDVSPGNILIAHDRAYLMDFELAHRLDDASPAYRRGTRGYFEPRKMRDAHVEVSDDAFAMGVLREMVTAGTPAVVSAYAKPSADENETETEARSAYVAYTREGTAQATWNVYGGIAGACLLSGGGDAELAAGITRAAGDVVHVPGFYFGASGMAVAVAMLGDVTRAEALMGRIDIGGCEVPDVCQGVAGYLLAALRLHEITKRGTFLELARTAAAQLIVMGTEENGARVWRWPVGSYGDLSGAACYGFGHGVAGVVYALMRLQEVASESRVLEEIGRGLESLARTAREVPGGDGAVWWPVSSRDETCWNAWCHGTPGVILALARARRNRWDGACTGLLERALKGMYLANNSELCLCHGVASRLDAVCDCMEIPGYVFDDETMRNAAADARILARALDAGDAEMFAGEDEGHGLMTGDLGVRAVLGRFRSLGG